MEYTTKIETKVTATLTLELNAEEAGYLKELTRNCLLKSHLSEPSDEREIRCCLYKAADVFLIECDEHGEN